MALLLAASSPGAQEADLPPLYVGFGSEPRATGAGRIVESIFHLYSRPSVWLERLEDDPKSDKARLLRLAKFPLDFYVASVHSVLLHELGHAEAAWANGATVSWERTPSGVSGAFGRWLVYRPTAPWPIEHHLAATAGGLIATSRAVEDTYRRMLHRDRIEFSYLPLIMSHKLDLFRYVFSMPKLGYQSRRHAGSDTLRYLRDYAVASGHTDASVYWMMRRGAIWSILDPMLIWSTYQYVNGFVWNGRQMFDNPLVSDRLHIGTGFWLSEVGPQYRLPVLIRGRGDRATIEIVPSWGDYGQWSFEGRFGRRAHVRGAVWSQRDRPEPGPRTTGGSIGVGIDAPIGTNLSIEAVAGYKTRGALFGRSFGPGSYFEVGLWYGR